DLLGERPGQMLTEYGEVHALGLLARAAVLAGPIADAGVHDHVVPDLDRVDGRPDLVDNARGVAADDPRRRDFHVRQTAHDEQVQVIERAGEDADADVGWRGQHRRGQIRAVLQLIESAMRGDRESSHPYTRRLYFSAAKARGELNDCHKGSAARRIDARGDPVPVDEATR